MDINITFNSRGFRTKAVDLAYREAVRDILAYAEDRAKTYAPRRTGNLQRNIDSTRVIKTGGVCIGEVHVKKTAPYAKWVESGTGMWGPYHMPIVPKTGNFLKFKWKGHTVYARSVKGQHGRHFMELAYQDTNRLYIPYRLQKLKREIGAALSVTT